MKKGPGQEQLSGFKVSGLARASGMGFRAARVLMVPATTRVTSQRVLNGDKKVMKAITVAMAKGRIYLLEQV